MARRRRRPIRRLIILLAIVACLWWLLGHVGGSGEITGPGALHRVVAASVAPFGAAYRAVADGIQAVQSQIAAKDQPASRSTAPAPATPARDRATPGGFAVPATAARIATPLTGGGATVASVAPTGVPRRPGTPSTGRRATMPAAAHPRARVTVKQPPASALLQNDYQVFETWNNCGPASLSMALSYFGIHKSQAELGQDLRPYQNQTGDNDDKDVTMDALAQEARTFGLLAYHRPNGNIRILKEFVASGMPVIAETVLTKGDDIGHYRVVKGYDDRAYTITQDDSMQGHNVQFSYADLDYMWKKYNYEYLVLVPRTKQALAEAILSRNLNTRYAWQQTVRMDRAALAANPSDVDSRFNLSVALYYVGDYRGSVAEFERVQYQLPARTLWYQIEPIEAYYRLGEYQKVFSLTDAILNNGNRAFSQLYIIRGRIYQQQGNIQAARAEFEKAVFYNTNLKAARDALKSVS